MERAITPRATVPAPVFFLVSAIFHYLGPSFAVLLFAHLNVLGVAWLRIASAGVIFAVWRRPPASLFSRPDLRIIITLGAVLAAMNSSFYVAISRLPLSSVGSIEFLGTIVLAAYGLRTYRNFAALCLTMLGIGIITQIRLLGEVTGFAFAFLNCALFMLYIVLGHEVANTRSNIDKLAASMLIATVLITPIGLAGALPAFSKPSLLLAGIAVGICSSVIPYIMDQLAMARLPRATFALMLALLPIFATIIGATVLHQMPTLKDGIGIACVASGLALHRQE